MRLLILAVILLQPLQVKGADLAFMVIDGNSYLAHLALDNLPQHLASKIDIITSSEIAESTKAITERVQAADVIAVDVMGRELEEYLKNNIELQEKTIYALRGSNDDEALKKLGFIFDESVSSYYRHISSGNVQNMLKLIINRHLDSSVSYQPPVEQPQLGIYHPKATEVFSDYAAFDGWRRNQGLLQRDKPTVGLLFYSSFLTPGQKQPIDVFINKLEASGLNVVACFGKDLQAIKAFLLDAQGQSRVDLVLAYSLKFYSALNAELADVLKKLDVPLVSAISLYSNTIDEWRESVIGIAPLEVAWAMSTPEISGLIEPTVLTAKKKIVDEVSGKTYFISGPVPENIDRLIPRLHALINLQNKQNQDKKVAIFFYNHHQGKQNIGASYLNVFKSLEVILAELAEKGYQTGELPDHQTIQEMILSKARNVGSWAPGELNKLVAAGGAKLLNMEVYRSWFAELPEEFRDNVIRQWGKPEESLVMAQDGRLILPMVELGNVVILPEPARGWSDDPEKLYHDSHLYPHHQYIAVYLWLQKQFKADGMIHLGTHATYEWTPGKQAGLSPSCPPEVLISDIPNIYPYIVDNVGEALQAKRRGRGIMISHLTPATRRSDLYGEYAQLADLIAEYELAKRKGSDVVPLKLEEIRKIAEQTGIIKDLDFDKAAHEHEHSHHSHRSHSGHSHHHHGHKHSDDQFVHLLGHYLADIKEEMIPYGMHVFGKQKDSHEYQEMLTNISQWHTDIDTDDVESRLVHSAENELKSLTGSLAGRHVAPGPGNDPMRNPSALPTGRNLYGFNPQKLPSPEAWKLGKEAAEQILANHLREHGTYPNRVAVILWAVELQRNEGVNESTILWLIGVRPTWHQSGKFKSLEIVSRQELGRPRVDVLINASGLYRDQFPDKIRMLDEAVNLAIRQTDIDNILAKNSRKLKKKLQDAGVDETKADEMSRLRIFSEESGAYGNGVGEMASASSYWNDEKQVADIHNRRVGFAFSKSVWGLPAEQLLKDNLKDVEVVVHSRSSNIYGLLDNDDMFQYLGGLAMAVRNERGESPTTYLTLQNRPGSVQLEDLGKAIGKEIRSRNLNPKWIEGMKAEGYAGASMMSNYLEYLWGWQMTTPEHIDAEKWQQTYEVYIEDKYNLNLKQFFDDVSPWAYQSIAARMLETVRKGYWNAPQEIRQKLAQEYAESVITRGVACCDHTCNNPILNQMVVSLLSLPGVLNTELAAQFKIAIEQANGMLLDKNAETRERLIDEIASRPTEPRQDQEQEKESVEGSESAVVEGYKIEKLEKSDDTTTLTSSGVEWLAGVMVLAVLGLIVIGMRRRTL